MEYSANFDFFSSFLFREHSAGLNGAKPPSRLQVNNCFCIVNRHRQFIIVCWLGAFNCAQTSLRMQSLYVTSHSFRMSSGKTY